MLSELSNMSSDMLEPDINIKKIEYVGFRTGFITY